MKLFSIFDRVSNCFSKEVEKLYVTFFSIYPYSRNILTLLLCPQCPVELQVELSLLLVSPELVKVRSE